MNAYRKKPPIFQRPPRFLPEMPKSVIEIPNPPRYVEKPEISWFSLLIPPLVMVVITILIAMSFKSIYMLISIVATITTIIGSIATASNQIRKYQKEKANRETKYRQLLANIKSDLEIYKQQQINAMNQLDPSPEDCVELIKKIDSKLWERTPSYNDFLSLRVGVGSVPSNVKVTYTKQELSLNNDPLADEPQKLALEFERVNDVPVSVNLFESEICGFAGIRENVLNAVRTLLLQLVTHHSYDDVKVVLLFSEDELKEWEWIKCLPHIWSSDFKSRYMSCGPIMAHQMLREMYDVLKERELKAGRNDSVGNLSNLPHYVFIVADSTLLENEAISKYLYQGNKNIGVSSIFLADRQEFLPMNCKTVVTIQNKTGIVAHKSSGVTNEFMVDNVSIKELENVARILAPIRMKQSGNIFSLPKSITLMEMLNIKKVEEIDVSSRWESNKTYKGMSVPVGARIGGEIFNLDIQSYEISHGPHGLVAGTTGSGKSELLQTLIISLAINYHPHDVVFVLIDYKGGGMADIFKGMPHLVGTITNLDGNQTMRALVSIKSELNRRQEIFSKYKVNNIDKYQKLYHMGQVKEDGPIPHLVIIADEFAELKAEQPEFMKELISTARLGRSLGVHLILATQKPAGVVDDQIWSNSRFKICLKVQDEGDSRDVIKRPDAAMIKEPGRAYIQVGNDEIFELFQSAWSGAEYNPEDEDVIKQKQKKYLYKVDLLGRTEQIYPMDEDLIKDDEKDTQLKVVIDYIIKQANINGIEALKGPWLPPLEEKVYLDDIYSDINNEASILSPAIGILDNPREQVQKPLCLDFAKEGHLFIYGASGTGKTTLLQTLIMSLAHIYSPKEVNIYIMDFGGGSLKIFDKLPHCGGVMSIEEEQKINQFILFIFRIIEERKSLFEKENVGNYISYVQTGKSLPSIFLLIDNYFALSEIYEEVDDKMIILAREGMKYGIYIVATATNVSFVKYKFSVNFKMAIALQLTEKIEYDSVVGRTEGLEPSAVLGRGLVRNHPPLEFQTSLPIFKQQILNEISEDISEIDKEQYVHLLASKESYRSQLIQKNIQGYKEVAQGTTAVTIPEMPNSINIYDLSVEAQPRGEFVIPLGKNDNDLKPVLWDMSKTPNLLIAGHIQSGKSTLIKSWIRLLAKEYPEKSLKIYAIDSNSMGLYEIMFLPHVLSVNELEDIEDFVEKVKDELDIRRRQINKCKKAKGDLKKLYKSWQQIIFAIDNLNEFTDAGYYGLKDLLERIVKKEYGLKISIMAAGNINELESNWDSLAKALRECQCGLLLGSLKEQNIFNAKLPYGSYEKEFAMGDGYFINKNAYVGLRTGYYFDD